MKPVRASVAVPWLCPPPAPRDGGVRGWQPPAGGAAGAMGGGVTPRQLHDGWMPLQQAATNVDFRIMHIFEVAAIQDLPTQD